MVLSAGTRLGPYEILAPLGAGGMGEVYLARDPRLDRAVAVKVLPARFAESKEALLRFEREAKVVAALSHPNILAIHDFGVEAGVPYAVTELLEGETLRERLARSTLPWRDAVEIGASIAEGLSAAHARGVVHRDLKPDNVFLTSDGRVKILDFGLAKRDPAPFGTGATAAPTVGALTEPGTVLGTVGYMAPEQARGLPTSVSGDIFSFGCVLYEALAGQPAFERPTSADTIAAILNEDAPDLALPDRDVPAELASLVARCLKKNPGERFESARDLAFALRTIGRPEARARRSSASESGTPGRQSIAVLPFADMSAEKNQDYFCEGIAEEIITALTAVPGLRVAARTSSFTFRAGTHDTREIGRRLTVETLLDGSVRKSGDRIRVTVQLVDAGEGYQLWSERYERDLKDVFAIQDEIAMAVVDRLRGSLLGRAHAHLVRKATDDPAAYNFYLRGRYHWNRQTGDDLARAIGYFDRAIAADPGYAAAHAALADTYSLLVNWGAIHPREMERGRTAALRATRLDDGLAAGHSSLAVLHAFAGKWRESEREHRRALELNPGDATGHMLFAMSHLAPQARADEAIAHMERAQELDPVSPFIAVCMAWAFYVARRYERARDVVRRALEMEPAFALAHWTLGLIRAEMDEIGPAIASLEEGARLSVDGPFVLGDLGRVYAVAGRAEDARKILARLEELAGARYVSPLNHAVIHLGLGELEASLDWLEKACEERGEQVYWLKASPRFDPLRGHPRFAACLERLGFEPEMQKI